MSAAGILNPTTADVWGQITLLWGRPVYYNICSGISGLYPLDANTSLHLPIVTTYIVSGHCQMFTGGQNSPQLRNVGPHGPGRESDLTELTN